MIIGLLLWKVTGEADLQSVAGYQPALQNRQAPFGDQIARMVGVYVTSDNLRRPVVHPGERPIASASAGRTILPWMRLISLRHSSRIR